MAGTAVIALEGVLRNPQGQPIPEGIRLYHALKTQFSIVVAATDLAQHVAEHWLSLEGLRDHVKVMTADVVIGNSDVRYEQLRVLGGIGARPQLVVDPSPSRVAMAMACGYTTLLFGQPSYARPEWRADNPKGLRAWSEIETELEKQAEQKAKDPRVDAEMTVAD